MTREQFLDLVREPSSASQLSHSALSGLLEQFPYCQPLRILQLRQLRDQNSVQYSQQLKIASAYAPDRTRLFNLMHEKPEVIRQKNEYSAIDTVSDLLINTDSESPTQELSNNEIKETVSVFDEINSEVIAYSIPPIESEIEKIEEPINTINTNEPIEESTFSTTNIVEDDSYNVNTELSPQQIIELRLKELNIWKEEVSALPVINIINKEESDNHLVNESEITETKEVVSNGFPKSNSFEKESDFEVEAKIIPIESISEIKEAPITTGNLEENSHKEGNVSVDPIDELIQESIFISSTKNADYFADEKIENSEHIAY